MMILSIFKQFNWMARWGIAYTVAIAAGLRAYGFLNSYILNQIKRTIVPLANTGDPIFHITEPSLFNNLIILIGTITGLLYFFSKNKLVHLVKLRSWNLLFDDLFWCFLWFCSNGTYFPPYWSFCRFNNLL